MKGTLEFNLPEEQEEFEIAQNGGQYASIINDLDNYLRTKTKYGEKNVKVYQEIRDYLTSLTDGLP